MLMTSVDQWAFSSEKSVFVAVSFLNNNLFVLLNTRIEHLLYLRQGDYTEVFFLIQTLFSVCFKWYPEF